MLCFYLICSVNWSIIPFLFRSTKQRNIRARLPWGVSLSTPQQRQASPGCARRSGAALTKQLVGLMFHYGFLSKSCSDIHRQER